MSTLTDGEIDIFHFKSSCNHLRFCRLYLDEYAETQPDLVEQFREIRKRAYDLHTDMAELYKSLVDQPWEALDDIPSWDG